MNARFDIGSTSLAGLSVLTRKQIGDSRGWLERAFCTEELREVLGKRSVVQINHTLTRQTGSVRGMHFQHAPSAEMKFVSCLRGQVFDVAVDLRPGSVTFLQWHAELLSAENIKTLAIPGGICSWLPDPYRRLRDVVSPYCSLRSCSRRRAEPAGPGADYYLAAANN